MARDRNPRGLRKAVEIFEDFHDFDVRDVGTFAAGVRIPPRVFLAGKCQWVTYRSDKWGKGTYDYVHDITSFPKVRVGLVQRATDKTVKLPARIQNAETLTFIGKALGFGYVAGDGEEVEAKPKRGYEWYWSTEGKALILIASKRRVHAVVWGGGLNVTRRGIVG